eukprot:gb/GECG01008169.1/.p1 GENE.gb/GECG01008169.1/~~gb/GECG01008169.1/.p1  ORF type:complete len:315 (+),score=15.91 gb/GECG01008169.1/:1-945(+)
MTDRRQEETTPLLINNDTAEIDLTDIFGNSNAETERGVFSRWFGSSQTSAADSSSSSFVQEASDHFHDRDSSNGARAPVMNRNTRYSRRGALFWHRVDDGTTEVEAGENRPGVIARIQRAFWNCVRCRGSCGQCFCAALGCMPCIQGFAFCWAIISVIFLRRYPTIIGLLFMTWLITFLAAIVTRLSFQPDNSSEGTPNIAYSRHVRNVYRTRSGQRIPWRNLALMMNEGNFTDQGTTCNVSNPQNNVTFSLLFSTQTMNGCLLWMKTLLLKYCNVHQGMRLIGYPRIRTKPLEQKNKKKLLKLQEMKRILIKN